MFSFYKKIVISLILVFSVFPSYVVIGGGDASTSASQPAISVSRSRIEDLPETLQNALLNLSANDIKPIDRKFYPYILRGKDLAESILQGTQQELNDPSEYLRSVIDLMWFFYAEAIAKGQAFNEGAFVIEDIGFKFYTFLMKYAQMRNASIKDDPKQDKIPLTNAEIFYNEALKVLSNIVQTVENFNEYAYPRISSHLTAMQFTSENTFNLTGIYRHYGIDIRFGDSEDANAEELPTGDKRHILFGKMGDNLLFIKLEDWGLAPKEVIKHGKDYVLSLVPKAIDQSTTTLQGLTESFWGGRSTAVISKSLSSPVSPSSPTSPLSLDSLCSPGQGDDQTTYRKERIPSAFKQEVQKLVKDLSKEDQKTLTQFTNTFGMRGLYYLLQNNNEGNIQSLLKTVSGKSKTGATRLPHEKIITLSRKMLRSKDLKDIKVLLTTIIDRLKTCYDHIELRTGREVIFTQEELLKSFEKYSQKSTAEKKEEIVKQEKTVQEVFGNRVRVYNNSGARLLIKIERDKEKAPLSFVVENNASLDVGEMKEFVRGHITIKYHKYGKMSDVVRGGESLTREAINVAGQAVKRVSQLAQETVQDFKGWLSLSKESIASRSEEKSASASKKEVHDANKIYGNSEGDYEVEYSDSEQFYILKWIGREGICRDGLYLKVSIKEELLKPTLIIGEFEPKSLPKTDDPYQVFPGIIYWSKERSSFDKTPIPDLINQYPEDSARYILGLPKEFDVESLDYVHSRLLEEWSPEFYPENSTLVAAIREKIKMGYEFLKSKKNLQQPKKEEISEGWEEVSEKKEEISEDWEEVQK